MKKIYLFLMTVFALTFAVNAQSIVDETFESITDPFGLPIGISVYQTKDSVPKFVDGRVMFSKLDSVNGLEIQLSNVTDSVTFYLKVKSARLHNQRSAFVFERGDGSPIAMISGFRGKDNTETINGGYAVLSDYVAPYDSFNFAFDDRYIKEIAALGGLTGQEFDYIFEFTINTIENTFTAKQDVNDTTIGLFTDASSNVTLKLLNISNTSNANITRPWYLDSLAIVGSGELVLTSIDNFEQGSNYFTIPNIIVANTALVVPEFTAPVSNYNYSIYNLAGKKVFTTTSLDKGYMFNNSGMYIYQVSGTTIDGVNFNKSGKIIVQ